jgi:plasmid stabilization system protein ParE
VAAGHQWYEREQPGLGGEFLRAVERVLDDIAANPARYGFLESDVRAGPTGRFPYAVYYRVLSDRVRVIAIQHTARDSARWLSRT